MPDSAPFYRKTFEDNIEILLDELKLAIQWDRPSILLAVHKTTPSQAKAEQALESELRKIGQNVARVEATPRTPSVVETILQSDNRDKTVFFVSNIERGGGEGGKDAYKALNLYREHFVENRIRVVFWLTVNEALALPQHATDFWAFRHRVVEFASPHGSKKSHLPAGVLAWHIQATNDPPARIREKITSRERLLKEVPVRQESLSTRIELLYTLAYLYWSLGENARAQQSLAAGIELAKQNEFSRMKTWLLNGAAVIHYEAAQYQKAHDLYTKLTTGDPQDGLLWMNHGIVLCALGKNSEAGLQGRKAVKIEPANARFWNAFGFLHLSMGKPDDAVLCFKKAIELAPTHGGCYQSLAACYFSMGLSEEALEQLSLARNFTGDQVRYSPAYDEAALGRPEKAVGFLRTAIENRQVSGVDVRRDAVLHFLLDEALIKTLP
jgi:tetratricopeptide (TPR) repeat protein